MLEFDKNIKKYFGKEIASISIENDEECVITFRDGTSMSLLDEHQNCCEERWMNCDDNLDQFSSALLNGAEILDCDSIETDAEGDQHDTSFLRIDTTLGSFRLCMHNKHNGYYGGFDPVVREG